MPLHKRCDDLILGSCRLPMELVLVRVLELGRLGDIPCHPAIVSQIKCRMFIEDHRFIRSGFIGIVVDKGGGGPFCLDRTTIYSDYFL